MKLHMTAEFGKCGIFDYRLTKLKRAFPADLIVISTDRYHFTSSLESYSFSFDISAERVL